MFGNSIRSKVMARIDAVIEKAQDAYEDELATIKSTFKVNLQALKDKRDSDKESALDKHVEAVLSKVL